MFIKNICAAMSVVAVTVSLTGCLPVAVGAGAEAGYLATQNERSAKETLADQVLVSKIKTKFLADQNVPGMDINVDSFRSTVTLRGALRSEAEINKAIEIAKNTDGVKGVVSKLVLVN